MSAPRAPRRAGRPDSALAASLGAAAGRRRVPARTVRRPRRPRRVAVAPPPRPLPTGRHLPPARRSPSTALAGPCATRSPSTTSSRTSGGSTRSRRSQRRQPRDRRRGLRRLRRVHGRSSGPATRSRWPPSSSSPSTSTPRRCSRSCPGAPAFADTRDVKPMLLSPRATSRPRSSRSGSTPPPARRPQRLRLQPRRLGRCSGRRDRARPARQLPAAGRGGQRPGGGRARPDHGVPRVDPRPRPPTDARRPDGLDIPALGVTNEAGPGAQRGFRGWGPRPRRGLHDGRDRDEHERHRRDPRRRPRARADARRAPRLRWTGRASTTTAAGRWRSSRSPRAGEAPPGRRAVEGPGRVLDGRGDRPAGLVRLRRVARAGRGSSDRGLPQLRHARARRTGSGRSTTPPASRPDGSEPHRGPLHAGARPRRGDVGADRRIGGASDHFPFDCAGSRRRPVLRRRARSSPRRQAGASAGPRGLPEDPCYHLACDTRRTSTAGCSSSWRASRRGSSASWPRARSPSRRADAEEVVGVAGFEPTTSSSRTMRATRLRYTPTEVPLRARG